MFLQMFLIHSYFWARSRISKFLSHMRWTPELAQWVNVVVLTTPWLRWWLSPKLHIPHVKACKSVQHTFTSVSDVLQRFAHMFTTYCQFTDNHEMSPVGLITVLFCSPLRGGDGPDLPLFCPCSISPFANCHSLLHNIMVPNNADVSWCSDWHAGRQAGRNPKGCKPAVHVCTYPQVHGAWLYISFRCAVHILVQHPDRWYLWATQYAGASESKSLWTTTPQQSTMHPQHRCSLPFTFYKIAWYATMRITVDSSV